MPDQRSRRGTDEVGPPPPEARSRAELVESEQRFRLAFESSPVGIGLIDEQGCFIAANAALCELLGRDEGDLIGRSAGDITGGSGTTPQRGRIARHEIRHRRPDGSIRWIWSTSASAQGPDGRSWTLVHAQDVTDRKLAELALRESEANLSAVAAVMRRIQGGEDARTTIVDAARALSGASFAGLLEPQVNPDGSTDLVVTATTQPSFADIRIPVDAHSATATVFTTGEPMMITDPADNPVVSSALVSRTGTRSMCQFPVAGRSTVSGVLVVAWAERVEDFTQRSSRALVLLADEAGLALQQERLMRDLERLAVTDELTGLANRRGWDVHLEELMAASRRTAMPLTVAIGDLDNFKRYNDSHGHHEGDRLLRGFADGARSALREADYMARWGGEEFAIALPGCSWPEAAAVLERVRVTVPHEQTCSFGFATWDGVESAHRLIARADQALYEAKSGGRDQVRASA